MWRKYFVSILDFDIVKINFNDNFAVYIINACVCFEDLKSKTYYHSTEYGQDGQEDGNEDEYPICDCYSIYTLYPRPDRTGRYPLNLTEESINVGRSLVGYRFWPDRNPLLRKMPILAYSPVVSSPSLTLRSRTISNATESTWLNPG